jgi:hypothetical protein
LLYKVEKNKKIQTGLPPVLRILPDDPAAIAWLPDEVHRIGAIAASAFYGYWCGATIQGGTGRYLSIQFSGGVMSIIDKKVTRMKLERWE